MHVIVLFFQLLFDDVLVPLLSIAQFLLCNYTLYVMNESTLMLFVLLFFSHWVLFGSFLNFGGSLILFLQHPDPIGSGSALIILEVAGSNCIVPGQICTCQITWSQGTFSSMPSFFGYPCLICLRLLEFSDFGVFLGLFT